MRLLSKAMSSDVSCLTYDWTAGNLYWFDATYNWIKVLNTYNGGLGAWPIGGVV